MKMYVSAFLALLKGFFTDPFQKAAAIRLGVPYVSGGADYLDKSVGMIGVVIGLLIVVYVLATALPLGITALIAVDTGSTLFNTFMNTIFPLIIAAFAVFAGLKFLKMEE